MSLSVCAVNSGYEHGSTDDEREHGRLGNALVQLRSARRVPSGFGALA